MIIDTLRRDHLSCYGPVKTEETFGKPVYTEAFDAFAKKGALFEQAYLGSFPCMPARRDMWTGRYEFPFRGWGPLEDYDLDMVSLLKSHGVLTQMISDHYHIIERDAGNYHGGFDGWEMIRGQEHDPYRTDPFEGNEQIDHLTNQFWYMQNNNIREKFRTEEELFAPQVFRKASAWLESNATKSIRSKRPFFLMIECFDPHEPWDPPMHMVDELDPDFQGKRPHSPTYGTADRYTPEELKQMQALYAAELKVVDRWFGSFMQKVEQLGLYEDTLIIAVTDHGFYLGEHNLVGKPNLVPLYGEMSHIPLFMYHPEAKSGLRRKEIVQAVDIMPTILDALGIELPVPNPEMMCIGMNEKKAWEGIHPERAKLHGKSLLPLLKGEDMTTRPAAFSGKFGDIIRICDGEWAMYISPNPDKPLYWYGTRAPGRTFAGKRGPYDAKQQRYPMEYPSAGLALELYRISTDPRETQNVAADYPEKVKELTVLFRNWLEEIGAPVEVADRYAI
ncbi:sulfatase [Paenibacillus sp. PL2-23]